MNGVYFRAEMGCLMAGSTEFAAPEETTPADPKQAKAQRKRGRRASKGLSEDRLYQAALYYLGRYAASTASVRNVLRRRVTKYAEVDGVDVEVARGWIDPIIERLTRSGVLDDEGFALGRAGTLFGRGLSMRMIRVKLAEKGLPSAVVERAIESLLETHRDPDLAAAQRYTQRRRLGPFRSDDKRESYRDRDLGAMARAGFSFEIARLMIDAESVDSLEALDRGR
jgi:regulatory protein